MLFMLVLLVAGIGIPLWSMWKWRGGWKIAAAIPVAVIAFVAVTDSRRHRARPDLAQSLAVRNHHLRSRSGWHHRRAQNCTPHDGRGGVDATRTRPVRGAPALKLASGTIEAWLWPAELPARRCGVGAVHKPSTSALIAATTGVAAAIRSVTTIAFLWHRHRPVTRRVAHASAEEFGATRMTGRRDQRLDGSIGLLARRFADRPLRFGRANEGRCPSMRFQLPVALDLTSVRRSTRHGHSPIASATVRICGRQRHRRCRIDRWPGWRPRIAPRALVMVGAWLWL